MLTEKFVAGLRRVADWCEQNPNAGKYAFISDSSDGVMQVHLGTSHDTETHPAFEHFAGKQAKKTTDGRTDRYEVFDSDLDMKFTWDVWHYATTQRAEPELVLL